MTTRRRTPDHSEDASAAGAAELQELKARIGEMEVQAEEAQNRHLRLAADFENYKKRARQEQLETIQYGSKELILRLLPVLDDFHRVLEHAPSGVDEGWLKGLVLTLGALEEVLQSQGVTPIEAVGAPFDPSLHEAIGHEESAEHPEDTVVSELRRGYRLHDRVVRPALVRVARPPEQLSSGSRSLLAE
jgi:molecular chaperone GrpE